MAVSGATVTIGCGSAPDTACTRHRTAINALQPVGCRKTRTTGPDVRRKRRGSTQWWGAEAGTRRLAGKAADRRPRWQTWRRPELCARSIWGERQRTQQRAY